jgi:Flp pilus assembly protein TadB
MTDPGMSSPLTTEQRGNEAERKRQARGREEAEEMQRQCRDSGQSQRGRQAHLLSFSLFSLFPFFRVFFSRICSSPVLVSRVS